MNTMVLLYITLGFVLLSSMFAWDYYKHKIKPNETVKDFSGVMACGCAVLLWPLGIYYMLSKDHKDNPR